MEDHIEENDLQEELQAEPTGLERQLSEAQEEAQTNLAGWQRAQADFANYKKREEDKKAELLDFAKEVTIVKLLPTLDSLEQGLKHSPAETAQDFHDKYIKWLSGIEATMGQLNKVLAEMGVQKIKALGQQFDPNLHEAVRETLGEDDGIIVEELQTGYQLNGRVVRPSQVVISKKN